MGPAVLTADPTIAVSVPIDEGVTEKKLGIAFWVAVTWVAINIIMAIIAPLLPLHPITPVGSLVPNQGPGLHHLLGTDDLGRDLFSRVVYGARVSLVVGFASIFVGLIIGGGLGLMAGFFRGRVDLVANAVANIFLAFPALIFLLALVTFWGATLFHVTLAIGLLSIAPLFRVVRGSTIIYSERDFVLASRTLGAKNGRIMIKEILPNIIPTSLAFGLIGVAVAIVAEGGLAFLGLSVPAPTATWGSMISEGEAFLQQDPFISLWPALAMFILVFALNSAADRLRAYFDIKEGGL
ncbi:MAG: ABC transporter permease [Acidimicrobiales bacterium]